MSDSLLAMMDAQIASARALSADAYHAQELPKLEAARAEIVELIRKARLWDDAQRAMNKTPTVDDEEWQSLARAGHKIEAVKTCRALHGYGLRESVMVVDSYLDKRRG